MKRLILASLCVLLIFILAQAASAAWVPLTGDLVFVSSIPTGGLLVGDKLFSEFEVMGISGGGPPVPSDDTVLVQGGQDDSTGDYGLRFLLAWNAASDQFISANINYKVEILPGYDDWFLEDATFFLAVVGATGTGLVTATEMVYDADFFGNSLAALTCSRQESDGGANLIDSSYFQLAGQPAPEKEIWVRTGFNVQGGATGTASLGEFFQLYSQVPEPATICLLGLGSLTLLRRKRRA